MIKLYYYQYKNHMLACKKRAVGAISFLIAHPLEPLRILSLSDRAVFSLKNITYVRVYI